MVLKSIGGPMVRHGIEVYIVITGTITLIHVQ